MEQVEVERRVEVSQNVQLVRVQATDLSVLKEYIEALYQHDEDFECMVNIEEGLKSLFRNEALATPYFIRRGDSRIGYVILTKYHSVEKGGLTIYIDELYVEERFRRSGVGRQILDRIVGIARIQGAKTLWAQSEPYNEPAQNFFLSQGFAPNHNKNFELPL